MKRWWDHGGTTWKCVIVKPQVLLVCKPLQSNFGGYCSYPWNRVHRPSQQKCQDLATNIFEIASPRWCVRYILMSTCVLTSKNLRNANMGIGETIVWKASLRSGDNFLQTVADSIKKEVQRDRKQVPWIQMREKEIPRFEKNSQPCFKFSTGTEKKLHRNFASNIQKYIISALLSPVFQWAAFSM